MSGTRRYVVLCGVLFAALQTAYFFQLTVYWSAAYPSFLAVTLAWLAGSLAGLALGARWSDRRWLAASVGASLLAAVVLRALPHHLAGLLVTTACLALSGAHAGAFFRRNRELLGTAGRLFFWENNGFLLGWTIGFVAFVLAGVNGALALPPLIAVGVLVTRPTAPTGDEP